MGNLRLSACVACLLLLLLTEGSPSPIDFDYCLKVLPLQDECEWYLECLERLFGCGAGGYPVEYGYKYCTKFNSAPFTPAGKTWVNKTTVCLKQSLLPLVEAKLRGHRISCRELKKLAFDEHPKCYVSEGFCSLLLGRNVRQDVQTARVFLSIMQLRDFEGYIGFKQILVVLKACLERQ